MKAQSGPMRQKDRCNRTLSVLIMVMLQGDHAAYVRSVYLNVTGCECHQKAVDEKVFVD